MKHSAADGLLVAALSMTHSSEELWELARLIARAAVTKEIEVREEDEGRDENCC